MTNEKNDLDQNLTFKQIAKLVPPNGCHWMTVYRWASRGIKVGARNLKLQTLRIGGRRLATRRWLNDFLAAQQHDDQSREMLLAPSAKAVADELARELA